MFFNEKLPPTPKPEPLTEDERRSSDIVRLWDWYAEDQAFMDNKKFWQPDLMGVSKILETATLNLAKERRNFAVNLKNHAGFYDWLRRRTLPEPLTEQEETNGYHIPATMEKFLRNYNRSWNAATDPPEDFLNWFEQCDPQTYVNDKLESHGKELAAARAAFKEKARQAEQARKDAAAKAERERKANEQARKQEQARQEQENQRRNTTTQDRIAHYLQMLELEDGAGQRAVKYRFHKLSAKLHPDKGGSNYFQKQLIEARDYLLKHLHDEGPDWIPPGEEAEKSNVIYLPQDTPEFDAETGEIFNQETAPPEPEDIAEPEAFKAKDETIQDQEYTAEVRDALNRWELPDNPSCDAINDKYWKYQNSMSKRVLEQINDDYELLMETFCANAP